MLLRAIQAGQQHWEQQGHRARFANRIAAVTDTVNNVCWLETVNTVATAVG